MSKTGRGRVEVEAPTPFEPGRLVAMRDAHRLEEELTKVGTQPACRECFRVWPCTISRLLIMIPKEAFGG